MHFIPECVEKTIPVFFPCFTDQGGTAQECIEGFHYFIAETDIPGKQIVEYAVGNHGKTTPIQIDHHIITTKDNFIYIKLYGCFVR